MGIEFCPMADNVYHLSIAPLVEFNISAILLRLPSGQLASIRIDGKAFRLHKSIIMSMIEKQKKGTIGTTNAMVTSFDRRMIFLIKVLPQILYHCGN
jgi:hypothetical protein